jgi:NAD(P)-dependent dehydrogenase (short-subunit alcohol dehydrogenase family)
MPRRDEASVQPLAKKTALVTGGTGGIGGAIAIALADAGCRVTATGLTVEEIERFDSKSRDITPRVLDVTNSEQVARLVEEFSSLDILVNAAGIILRDNRELDPLDFARVLDVNLTGTMRMCAAGRPLLADAKGCVLNLASMLSYFGSGYVPGYSASKGGIVQLTKSLAIAWAKDGIRVNALAPGWIETPLTEALRDNPQRSREILDRTPLGRWGRPEDLAGAAVFLCSPAAGFITGVTLPVDGGYSIA